MKQVINKRHRDYKKLINSIDRFYDGNCNHGFYSFNLACDYLESTIGYEIDRNKTIEHLKENGGFCDCEILMNCYYVHDNLRFN